MNQVIRAMSFVAVAACLPAPGTCGGEIMQFRGNLGNGVLPDQPIPLTWSGQENLAWAVEIPGAGWSQPVIFGDRIYLTFAVGEDLPVPANFASGVRSPQSMGVTLFARAPRSEIKWNVYCLHSQTGEVVWSKTVREGMAKFSVHPSNSHATESPVVDAAGIYVYFGSAGIVAGLSHTGELRWTQDVGVFKTTNSFGTGSSLSLFEGKVYAQNFTDESAIVHCLATHTGEELWRFERDRAETSWSTPVIWRNPRRNELIVSGANRVDSLDPDDGETLWTVGNVKSATACSVCTSTNALYFGSSDPFSKGPLFAIEPGARGDVSPQQKNAKFESCIWLQEKQGPGMSSPVCDGGFVYTTDNNILKCFDAQTGERVYQARLPGLKMIAASPLIIGDRLLLLDENGRSCVVRVGPDFEILGQGRIEDTFWSTPAAVDGSIYLRGVKKLYCIREDATDVDQ